MTSCISFLLLDPKSFFLDSLLQGNLENSNSEKEQTQPQSENETYNSKSTNENTKSYTYIANNHTLKFHRPNCRSVKQMNDENKIYLNCTRADAINRGYEPCKHCEP